MAELVADRGRPLARGRKKARFGQIQGLCGSGGTGAVGENHG